MITAIAFKFKHCVVTDYKIPVLFAYTYFVIYYKK